MNNLSSQPGGSPQTPSSSFDNGTTSSTSLQPQQQRNNAFLFPNLLPPLSSPQFLEASRRSPSATRRSIFTVTSAMSQHMPRKSAPEVSGATNNHMMTPLANLTSPISSANASRVATPATSETTLDSGILSSVSLMETESSVSQDPQDANSSGPQCSTMNLTEEQPSSNQKWNEERQQLFQLDMSPIQAANLSERHHRHGSLEDLYRPTNHRSSAKKSKRKKAGLLTKYQSETSMHILQNVDSVSAVTEEPTEDFKPRDKVPLLTKASLAFMLGAIRGLRQKVSHLEAENAKKTRESAARSILHNLLLNSWRQCRKSNDKILQDNQLHKRTIENMCLQLRVLRQMHREEKQRSHERGVHISELELQFEGLKRQAQVSQSELEKVENELNNCQIQVETLQNLNNQMTCEKQALQERIVKLNAEKNEEIHKACRIEKEKAKVLEEVKELNQRLYDVTRSRNKWQEEANSKGSEIIGLKTDMCYKDKLILQAQNQNQELLIELNESKQMKIKYQTEEQSMLEKILQAKEEIQKLNSNAMRNEEALELQNGMIEALRLTMNQQQEKLTSTQEDLSQCLRASIEKRGKLADRFHYLVFPGDLLNLFFESGNDKSRYALDLKEITTLS